MTLELAAAAAARCSPEDEDAGDFVVVHQGGKLVLGALRVPISAEPGALRLCGDPEHGATMLAAMQLAEMAASDQGMFPKMTGVSGPAVLSEAFARHLCFKRRAREPEARGGLRVWSVREARLGALPPAAPPGEGIGRVEALDPRDCERAEIMLLGHWLEACEAEGGVPADSRTPGIQALARFASNGGGEHPGLYVWRLGDGAPGVGAPACVCGVVGDAARPGGGRIGLVYTPPALRRRGYATALVRAVSRELLLRTGAGGFTAIVTGAPAPDAKDVLSGLWSAAGYTLAGDTAEYRFAHLADSPGSES